MARIRFKRLGLGAAAKASVLEGIDAARKTISQVNDAYYFQDPEYQAAHKAGEALSKLRETLGHPDGSMWKDGARLATRPEDKKD